MTTPPAPLSIPATAATSADAVASAIDASATTLVHLSDLHFGRVDDRLLDPLVTAVHAASPRVVVVSGDLTQRARTAQFEQARDFLERLPAPRIVVPGNHDVPLYDVFARMLTPVDKFRRIIEPKEVPAWIDDRVAVVGVNTARSNVIKNGRINREQLDLLRDAFAPLPREVVRVVVTHHPFEGGEQMDEDDRIGRARMAMHAFGEIGVDLLLSGHLHTSYSGGSDLPVPGDGRLEVLAVSAGTATSTRVRGEPNEFNVLRVAKDRVEVERQAWMEAEGAFRVSGTSVFVRGAGGWGVAVR